MALVLYLTQARLWSSAKMDEGSVLPVLTQALHAALFTVPEQLP